MKIQYSFKNLNPLLEISTKTYKAAIDNVAKKKGALATAEKVSEYITKSNKRHAKRNAGLFSNSTIRKLNNDNVRFAGLNHSLDKTTKALDKLKS